MHVLSYLHYYTILSLYFKIFSVFFSVFWNSVTSDFFMDIVMYVYMIYKVGDKICIIISSDSILATTLSQKPHIKHKINILFDYYLGFGIENP